MAAAVEVTERLSFSSKEALYWAEVMNTLRFEQGSESEPDVINVYDLFIGILLSHPKDSEAKILLDHFKLQPGQLLPQDYPLPDKINFERLAPTISTKSLPDMDSTVGEIVEIAVKEGLEYGSSEVAELRALYSALFIVTNPLTDRLNELLSTRGASPSAIVQINQEYLRDPDPKGGYAGLLSERLPFNQEPVRIPTYKADHGVEMNLSDDLVDIRAEVDAFAYLLASRGLNPPLAVGLFGDWGSGKTFFMDSVKTRINQLVTFTDIQGKKQEEVPFWKRIIQIDFNAWHYVEGDLWASLVDHIFNQLKLSGEEEDLTEERRKFWTEKLEEKLGELTKLEQQKKDAKIKLKEKHQEIQKKKQLRDQEIQALEKLKLDSTKEIILEESLVKVKDALKPLMISIGLESPDEIAKKLREARTELTRGRAFIHYFQDRQSRGTLLFIFLLVLATPFVMWWINSLAGSVSLNVTTGLSATLTAALGLMTGFTKWARGHLDVISQAEQKVEDEINSVKSQWRKDIDQKEEELAGVESEIDDLIDKEKKAVQNIRDTEEELKSITTAKVLNDFVSERAGSDDYRSRLGVPALIQKDFKNLTKLISTYNQECVSETPTKTVSREDADHYFNRIILYIDDLDRCPDKRVVEVLQAVHLLLAFELFVVVVAVDSRWLNHALKQHYPALTSFNGDRTKATSEDYLEKIFQVPFWVRSLNEGARKNIVAGLLKGNLEPRESVKPTDQGDQTLKVGEAEAEVLKSFDIRTTAPALDTATLTVTRPELDFLDELAPLLGNTPRSVKRFVNLYQLVRIVYRSSGKLEQAQGNIPEQSKLAFLLAISDGLTRLFPDFIKEIHDAVSDDTLLTVVGKINATTEPEEHKKLLGWINEREAFKNALAKDFSQAINTVERFIFRSRFRT